MGPGFSFPPPPPPPSRHVEQGYQHDQSRGTARGGRGSFHTRGTPIERGNDQGSIQPLNVQQNTSSWGQRPQHEPFNGMQRSYGPTHDGSSQGQKRKREGPLQEGSWRGSHSHASRPHAMKQKAAASKTSVAPAVPSFGAPFLPLTPVPSAARLPAAPSASTSSSIKLFGNGLRAEDALSMLSGDDSGSDTEDDEGEEEKLSAALGIGERLKFEHNGEFYTLSTAADIRAWIKDRGHEYPREERAQAKYRERLARMEERRQIEAETFEYLYGRPMDGNYSQPDTNVQENKSASTINRADELRALLLKQKMAKQETEASVIHPDVARYRNTAPMPNNTQAISLLPAEYDDGSSDASADDIPGDDPQEELSGSEDSGPPEEQSSKVELGGNEGKHPQDSRPCNFFAKAGRCRFGKMCRFQHVQPELDRLTLMPRQRKQWKPREERKSLHQRLVEQEEDAENKLALQAIKYLGSAGFFRRRPAEES